jgi:hypothetical protein
MLIFLLGMHPDGHAASQQPFFQYMLLTGDRHYFTNTNQIITSKKFIANKYNPFYSQSWFGSTVYKDWSTECVNLSAYMGQEVSVLFIVGDCSYTAHGAYAYIDCLCENNNAIATMTLNNLEFCQGDQITMDATATINEDSYFLAIAEADQFGNVIVGTERSQWFVAQQAGIIDFTALLNQWNYNLKCNTYYKVKLAVSNGCTNWNETSKFIFIHCPEAVDIGQYIVMCCNNPFPVTIKDGNYLNHPTYTYNWTSSPYWGFMANNPNLPSYNYTPFVSTTFNVTVTDDYGCTLDDEINIILEQNFTVSVAVEKLGCCTYNLVPYITFTNECNLLEEDPKWLPFKHNMLNYHWSDGYTGKEHQVSPAQNTTYSLTVSNGCFTQTVSVNVEGCPELSGDFPRLNYPPSMESTSNSINEWLVISNINVPSGTPNAYKATGYRLEVVDRWGGVHLIDEQHNSCEGFNNSTIYWNGRINGTSVQNGIYTFLLTLFNNTYPWDGNYSYTPFSNNLTPNGGKKMLDRYSYICTSYGWSWWCFCNECTGGNWSNHTQWYGTIIVSN